MVQWDRSVLPPPMYLSSIQVELVNVYLKKKVFKKKNFIDIEIKDWIYMYNKRFLCKRLNTPFLVGNSEPKRF